MRACIWQGTALIDGDSLFLLFLESLFRRHTCKLDPRAHHGLESFIQREKKPEWRLGESSMRNSTYLFRQLRETTGTIFSIIRISPWMKDSTHDGQPMPMAWPAALELRCPPDVCQREGAGGTHACKATRINRGPVHPCVGAPLPPPHPHSPPPARRSADPVECRDLFNSVRLKGEAGGLDRHPVLPLALFLVLLSMLFRTWKFPLVFQVRSPREGPLRLVGSSLVLLRPRPMCK